jgi:hypothetical protein
MAEDPEYYKKHINLFVALAPTILFKHSSEPYFKAWANETAIASIAMEFNYMEFNGENIPSTEVTFLDLIKE